MNDTLDEDNLKEVPVNHVYKYTSTTKLMEYPCPSRDWAHDGNADVPDGNSIFNCTQQAELLCRLVFATSLFEKLYAKSRRHPRGNEDATGTRYSGLNSISADNVNFKDGKGGMIQKTLMAYHTPPTRELLYQAGLPREWLDCMESLHF
jgi:hypothetical protein